MANDKEKILKRIANIENAIEDIKKDNFKMIFFIADSMYTPNSEMQYIYQMAKTMNDLGYKVEMGYQIPNEYTKEEREEIEKKEEVLDERRYFHGVRNWLGDEYADLPHVNLMNEETTVGPSDFLFIPETFSSFMLNTFNAKLPCKRYVILQNYNFVPEYLQFGHQWANYGIYDVVASNKLQADRINDVFKYTVNHTTVIEPFIPNYFRKPVTSKKLIVNVMCKNQEDVNRIVMPFRWKYPLYQFVTFRVNAKKMSKTEFAESLKESAITIWCDYETPFGYSALESIKCGNIVIGKIPENVPEWMVAEDGETLNNSGIWFEKLDDISDLLANVIGAWINDDIPVEITTDMDKVSSRYTYEEWKKKIKGFISMMKIDRITEFNTVINENKKEIED